MVLPVIDGLEQALELLGVTVDEKEISDHVAAPRVAGHRAKLGTSHFSFGLRQNITMDDPFRIASARNQPTPIAFDKLGFGEPVAQTCLSAFNGTSRIEPPPSPT
jgi:hypothetical protein